MKNEFIKAVQKFVSREAVGVTAMRGQGRGVLKKVRQYLDKLPLNLLSKDTKEEYLKWLDSRTKELMVKTKSWGSARKSLNLFMRTVFYNRYLNKEYNLKLIEAWMETPLDQIVAKELKNVFPKKALPRWPGVRHLNRVISDQFQEAASVVAFNLKKKTVHVDVFLWPRD